MKPPQWLQRTRERAGQVMKLVAEVRGWVERTIFWRVWERMLENEFIDRGVALAAKAFVSFFPALFAVLALAAAIGLWWVTPWVMLGRQVRLRVLLPTGVLTGLGMTVYGATAPLWMPTTVTQNQQQFGFFGVALALVTWLSGAAFIVVAAACAAPVLAEDRGVLGRLARGANPEVLVPGAVPSLGAPVRAPTLSNAIGIGPEAGTVAGPALPAPAVPPAGPSAEAGP